MNGARDEYTSTVVVAARMHAVIRCEVPQVPTSPDCYTDSPVAVIALTP